MCLNCSTGLNQFLLESGFFKPARVSFILSLKHVQKMALERSPEKRADFVHRIFQYPATYIIALDEVSKDDHTYARLWSRSELGTCVQAFQPFVRKQHFSMLVSGHMLVSTPICYLTSYGHSRHSLSILSTRSHVYHCLLFHLLIVAFFY